MNFITKFSKARNLPPSFTETATNYYMPLLEEVVKRKGSKTFILGINGAQGSGKSTLAEFLATAALELRGWAVTCISLDDIYHTKAARLKLAHEMHPLMETRGVPGTHDVDLGVEVLTKLRDLKHGETVAVPRFDKAIDDQLPKSEWSLAEGPQNLIIFEGWCMGCLAQSEGELLEPVNELEAQEDPDGIWRRSVNQSLLDYNDRLWSQLDIMSMLQVPSFEQVYLWRTEQENKLVKSLGYATELSDPIKMRRFIFHYERLTRHMLKNLGSNVDILMKLNQDHQVYSIFPEALTKSN
jgi:D-glycerate 3-kinase